MGLLKVLGIGKYLKKVKDYTDQQIANLVGSAPETLDTLQELSAALKDNADIVDTLNDAITKKADKTTVEDSLKNINTSISDIKNDLPFSKGEGENSAVLKGGNNQVISEGGVALGKDNVVGLKGWYYGSIYKENYNTISVYLSNEQKAFNSDEDFKTEYQTADESLPNLVEILGINAVISLVNAGKYDDKFIVIGGSNGVVRLQTIDESVLPFDIITGQSVINYEDYSIYCLSKPDAGIAELGKYSFAVGYNNKATNGESTAFGYNNHAYGKFSFVEGKDNKAGYASHAEGRSNIASGSVSHAEGRNNVASGYLSHAEGGYNIAEGAESHAEGYYTIARGAHSHAEGTETTAKGTNSHAEGYKTTANGDFSHAEGYSTDKATDVLTDWHVNSVKEKWTKKRFSLAYRDSAHVEGKDNLALGSNSHAEGAETIAEGWSSHAEGADTKTDGKVSHAEGIRGTAIGDYSHVEGSDSISTGVASHAEGYKTHAKGNYTHSEGQETSAEGKCSHSEGFSTEALGESSHAEGNDTKTEGINSHAEGYNTQALGPHSHAEGNETKTEGSCAHAEGYKTQALGKFSHAEGNNTISKNEAEHACGKYNLSNSDTRFSIGIGTSDTNRKNAFEVKQNGDIYAYDYKLATGCINVTHEELVNLRKNNRLIPGQQYRITDYITTTVQENTQSVGHQFDIIVVADDVNILNENARAIQHKGDSYFANSDLNSWELKYCLDNDTSRFAWADSTNGKGVIYYMKDEWNNECPYDFKNIKFARWQLYNPIWYRNDYDYINEEDRWIQESTPINSLKADFYGLNGSDNVFYYRDCNDEYNKYKVEYTISESPKYHYTFGRNTDFSISGSNYGNVIKEYKKSNKIQLNNIVFFTSSCHSNSFGYDCHSNSFGYDCHSNSFGYDCNNNSFDNYCCSNSFGNYFSSNSFGTYFSFNSFGNYCSSNSFDNSCKYNSFGDDCNNNSFGPRCHSNNFGNYCSFNSLIESCESNSFGNHCSSNNLGFDCCSNNFGNHCSSNSFSRRCDSNNFGNYCRYNSFGENCEYNSFGENCEYNSFGESKDNLKSYYRYIIFDNGNRSINLNCTSTTSSSKYYQNVRIGLGVNNRSSYKTINDSNVGQTYETCYKPANSQTITI